MKTPWDIEAEVYFFLPEEGGRSMPAFDKYHPQFYYNNNDWDAQHEYPDTEKVYPGETVKVYLAFMSALNPKPVRLSVWPLSPQTSQGHCPLAAARERFAPTYALPPLATTDC